MDWGELIQSILETILAIALPVLVGYAVVWLRAKQREIVAGLTDNQRWMVTEAVRTAVEAAEQSGLAGHIGNMADEKKRFAIVSAERYLYNAGLSIDLDVLSDMIEAEVYRQFRKPADAPVSILPVRE